MKTINSFICEKLSLNRNTKIEKPHNIYKIEWPLIYNFFSIYDIDNNVCDKFKNQTNGNGDCYWFGVTNEDSDVLMTFVHKIHNVDPVLWGNINTKNTILKDIKTWFPNAERIFISTIDSTKMSTSPMLINIECHSDSEYMNKVFAICADKKDAEYLYNLFVDEDNFYDIDDIELMDLCKRKK